MRLPGRYWAPGAPPRPHSTISIGTSSTAAHLSGLNTPFCSAPYYTRVCVERSVLALLALCIARPRATPPNACPSQSSGAAALHLAARSPPNTHSAGVQLLLACSRWATWPAGALHLLHGKSTCLPYNRSRPVTRCHSPFRSLNPSAPNTSSRTPWTPLACAPHLRRARCNTDCQAHARTGRAAATHDCTWALGPALN